MRQHKLLNRTLRDIPADAEAACHRLMLRAGLIRQLSAGVYTYLPLGLKALRNIENIVREEMELAGAQELLMPTLHPAELWQESGRWNVYGPELMRLEDRNGRSFALGATHEEVITTLLRDEIHSYKKLPVTLYQIQTKFRDERRPRFGLLRGREFIMKDAYSFDRTHEELDISYKNMYDAYCAIFTRCGINYRPVEADSGAMGGKDTHEFMALADIGEDTIAHCPACGYAANLEKAEFALQAASPANPSDDIPLPVSISTPGITTISQLCESFQMEAKQFIKALAWEADGKPAVVLVRGDYELSEAKVKQVLGAQQLELLTEESIVQELQSIPGFIGPIGITQDVKMIADYSVAGMADAVAGANAKDTHLMHVTPLRDLGNLAYMDLRNAVAGDLCPHCQQELAFAKGIEVGQVFKLGTRYSEKLGAGYLDEKGTEQPMVMGCYGIGVSRTLAAILEQNHDESGILWPAEIAPFKLHLLTVHMQDSQQIELSSSIYDKLMQEGLEVLWDDRDERPGVKFNDADLLGFPIRITVGKRAIENIVECKIRKTGAVEEVAVPELLNWIHHNLKSSG
jgi:prolyl-tRNA synthetase